MSKQQIVVTDEGLKKLTEELEYLKNVKRKEVVESIRTALSFGDLSENSEYDEAKNEQAKVESQINELEETLKHVKVISDEDISTEIVNIGAKIKVLDIEYDAYWASCWFDTSAGIREHTGIELSEVYKDTDPEYFE